MKVHEIMTHEVRLASPDDTLEQAAKAMAGIDVGMLPVGENDRLVGMITDRDIAIRGIANGKGPKAKIRDVMSDEVLYCFEDQELDGVTHNMGHQQIRRLPVLNRDKRLVGIIALGDIALGRGGRGTAKTLGAISEPTGVHSQSG